MKISIAERLKPFSHTPGAACLIPGTFWEIEAFPTLIRLGKKIDLHLHIIGPVKGFTLEQDLEKNCVRVFGRAKEGFYRLKIQGASGGIEVLALNAPPGFLVNGNLLRSQDRLFFSEEIDFFLPERWERLSLGSSKAKDWDLVLRRFDLREILPVLFGLGQKIPYIAPQPLRGTGRLLGEGNFEAFCLAGFSKILIPRLTDDQHQGLAPIEAAEGHPCYLLQEATRRIRSLFFRQEESRLFFLPNSSFEAGRMTEVSIPSIGEIDLEWASGCMCRAILRISSSVKITLRLSQDLRTFRVRTSPLQKGNRHAAEEPLCLDAGKIYYFDRFQK